MDFVDYYNILGVGKSATPGDIKNAYRKLARKFHPDLNPNDKDAKKNFQQINEANEVLSDPVKRKKFDQYGKDWQHAEEFEKAKRHQGSSSNSGRSGHSGPGQAGDFSDFFESMFGGMASGGRGRQVKYRGEDFNAEIHLNLTDALKTQKQTLTVNGMKIRITIPAGIENGQTIKIAGHGGAGVLSGPNGDLYITFSFADHPNIQRMGADLYTSTDLDLYTAILGGETTIDTLDGKVKISVKPGTQNESKVKLKGKGFPIYKRAGETGDLFVTYHVRIPTNLSDKQKEMFAELSELSMPA